MSWNLSMDKYLALDNLAYFAKNDPILYQMMVDERIRQSTSLNLQAASSVALPSVLAASSSCITNLTLEGYPGHRFHTGAIYADQIENIAIERSKSVFHAQYANVQPLSGAIANHCIIFGLLKNDDTILGMSLDAGGHLTHGARVSIVGKHFNAVAYGVDENNQIDYNRVADMAKKYSPKLIICGASAYPRLIDYRIFREIAERVGSLLLADISHIAGLIAAGLIPSPIDFAHFTTTSTYKQLYGPRGGLILMGQDYAESYHGSTLFKLIQSSVFPGCQGTPDFSKILAKAAMLREIQQPWFVSMMKRVIETSACISEQLSMKGYDVISGGTENHMVLINTVSSKNLSGVIASKALEDCALDFLTNDSFPFALLECGLG